MANETDAKIIPFRLPGSGSGRKRPHTGTTQHMQPSEGQSIKARGGLFFEFGVQAAPQRTRDEQTIATAWQRLLDMMAQGKLPEPAADYQLEQISYNPRFMGLNGGKQAVLAVEQVPSGPRSGSIIAFAPAAETLEHAVRCLAHELYRFHPSQGQDDDRCYQYAQSAVRILNGGKYAGPDVNEGLEVKEKDLIGNSGSESTGLRGYTRVAYPLDWSKIERSSGTFIATTGGMFVEAGRRVEKYRKDESDNVNMARREVDRLVRHGKVPKPEIAYKVDGVEYDERIMMAPDGPLGGLNMETSKAMNAGKILIFAVSAISLETAIKTYAHELWHFNIAETHDEDKANAYGDAVFRAWKGGDYDGPTPKYSY